MLWNRRNRRERVDKSELVQVGMMVEGLMESVRTGAGRIGFMEWNASGASPFPPLRRA